MYGIISCMRIIDKKITKAELANSENVFDGPMVKGVVDAKRGLLAVDAGMHADMEQLFLEDGSAQDDLWGINLWYEDDGEDFVEFDSMINVRPRQGNRSRGVEDEAMKRKIREVVEKWIQ